MNKAFIREPDDHAPLHCPACGSLGVPVEHETWQAHVVEVAREALADSAFFCPFPTCQVAYFDMFERQVPVDALAHSVYPKDPQAPICPCFDFTTESIEADVREGGVSRTRALLEKAKSADARCRTMSASGQSCTGDVQRYFMKLRGGA